MEIININDIIQIINNHEDSLSDGYKWYGGDDAVKSLATDICKHIEDKYSKCFTDAKPISGGYL